MATDFTFAYGSNMNVSELRSWLEGGGFDSSLIVDATPALLDGYDFVWNYYSRGRDGGACNLAPKENSTIWGVVVEFQESLLKAFDRKEGHPYFYSRGDKRVAVRRVKDDQIVQAWLYLAKPNRSPTGNMLPTREYKRIVLEAALFWNFPADYMEKIRNWDTQ